jgi:hypothetical protein
MFHADAFTGGGELVSFRGVGAGQHISFLQRRANVLIVFSHVFLSYRPEVFIFSYTIAKISEFVN